MSKEDSGYSSSESYSGSESSSYSGYAGVYAAAAVPAAGEEQKVLWS